MNKEQRALVRARLPGSRYANARWLYNCLLDLCTEAGCYTGTLLWLREYAGYGSGPSSAPRTTLLLDQLRRAGLIEYTYTRKEGARHVMIQLVFHQQDRRCA